MGKMPEAQNFLIPPRTICATKVMNIIFKILCSVNVSWSPISLYDPFSVCVLYQQLANLPASLFLGLCYIHSAKKECIHFKNKFNSVFKAWNLHFFMAAYNILNS